MALVDLPDYRQICLFVGRLHHRNAAVLISQGNNKNNLRSNANDTNYKSRKNPPKMFLIN